MNDLEEKNLWKYLDSKMQELIKQSFTLLELFRSDAGFTAYQTDYSFIVFPIAKAYEGFLKKVFLDMKLITRALYEGEHFRIGRALSPSLPKRYRSGWVYGKLTNFCNSDELPLQMWDVWKRARNRTFHYFPGQESHLSFEEAQILVEEIVAVMEKTLTGCGILKDTYEVVANNS